MITALQALEALDAWRDERSAVQTTGFAGLDEVTGGFERGQLWILVGTPGQGRSTLALQWALLLADRHGLVTHLVSRKEPARKIAARLVANVGKVPELRLWNGNFSSQDETRIRHATQTLNVAQLHIVAAGETSIVDTDMDEAPRPQALVVDDADLAGGIGARRASSIAALGTVVVLTVARSHVVTTEGIDPTWVSVADFIIDIDRPDLLEPTSLRPGEADLHLLRNRWGPMRSHTVAYQGHYARFVELV